MNHQEAVVLCRLLAAACPQQAIDDYTPDSWHDLLGDLSFADCHEAMVTIGKRQPFIAPAEIITEVRRIRAERIARAPIPAPPPELADDPRAYQAELQARIRDAADGHGPPVTPAIGGPDLSQRAGHPSSLRGALAGLRARLGPPRAARAIESPQQIAARQADASRSGRPQPADEEAS